MNMVLRMLLMAAIVALFSACSPPEPPSPPSETISPPSTDDGFRGVSVKYDVYDDMLRIGDEAQGYALYTYVLTPVEAKSGSFLDVRYKHLIHEIKSTTLTAKASAGFPKSESNIFYLPAGSAFQRHTLSLQLISHLHRLGKDSVRALLPLSRPGPFLVSIQHTVLGMNRHTSLLIADLTATNKSAFPELIAAYKKRLKHDGVEDTQPFESLRLSLLNFIFDVNDNLHLVRNALAEWQ